MSDALIRWYNRLPWLLGLLLLPLFVLLLRYEWQQQDHLWQEQLRWQAQEHRSQVDSLSRDLTYQAMLLAQLVLRDEHLLTQVRQIHPQFTQELASGKDTHTPILRQQLYDYLKVYWEDMHALGATQLNLYFNPGAINFLRMQRPQRYGDSLASLRPLLREVFSSGIPAWGMDINREGSGYSALVPIFADASGNGQVIAVLELTLASLPPATTEKTRQPMAVFLHKPQLDPLLWLEAQRRLNNLSHVTLNEWRLEASGDPQLLDWWSRGDMPIGQPPRLVTSGEHWFLLSWWPLSGPHLPQSKSGTSSVAMAIWSDITQAYQQAQQQRQQSLLVWGLLLLACELLVFGLAAVNRRIIRRLLRRHRQRLSEQQHQQLLIYQHQTLAQRSGDAGVWQWDLNENHLHFSPEWYSLCGLAQGASASIDMDDWLNQIHPADKRSSSQDLLRHIKGDTALYENEHRLRAADGSYRWILSRGKVTHWHEGKATRVMGVYLDITLRKQTELIAIRQQAALHSLNEIASLPALDSDEQLHHAIRLAAHYLGVGNGAVIEVRDGHSLVRIAQGKLDDSERELPLSQSLASQVISTADVVAEDAISRSPLASHAQHLRTGTESYIGVPLWIHGELYGCLCFWDSKSRQHDYDRLDKDFVRLLGRWISSVVERWQQERDKNRILDRFQKLSERLPGFLYQFQLTPDGQGFFPYASVGIHNLYGLSPEDVRYDAQGIFDIIHPEDIAWVNDSILYSATHLSPWIATVRIRHPQRGLIWSHAQALPERLPDGSILWNGYASDITPLKQTELELAQTNALNQAIFDAASVAIIASNTRGTITTFNRGAELMLGYSAEEIIGKQSPDLFHLPHEMAEQAQRLRRELGIEVQSNFDIFVARARLGGRDECEWQYRCKDGSLLPVLLQISALRDQDDEVFGYLGIAQDMSEIKRVDNLKSEFISNVSHELRTPLTAISGALGIVTSGALGELSGQLARLLGIAHNNAQRLITLVNDLLDMEKLVAGKMHFELRPQALLPIVRDSLETNASYAAQYQVRYALRPDSQDARVLIDRYRLEQVLANYLSNAAKFSPLGETVWVSVERRPGVVRVTVSDHGQGVPEDFHGRIFHKFSQADAGTSRRTGGTGLGLAICKEMIERMGGTLGFNSVPQQGASFYFELPCEDGLQAAPQQPPLSAPPSSAPPSSAPPPDKGAKPEQDEN